jgi:hypothetical protein
MASAQHGGDFAFQPTRQSPYPLIDVGMAWHGGPAFAPQQTQYGPRVYEQDRLAQTTVHVARPADQQYGNRPVYSPSPMLTPIRPSSQDPTALHLQWLHQQYAEERMSTNRAAVLETLMQQMQTLTNAMHGIVTPPKGVPNEDADTLSDAGVLASLKDDTWQVCQQHD